MTKVNSKDATLSTTIRLRKRFASPFCSPNVFVWARLQAKHEPKGTRYGSRLVSGIYIWYLINSRLAFLLSGREYRAANVRECSSYPTLDTGSVGPEHGTPSGDIRYSAALQVTGVFTGETSFWTVAEILLRAEARVVVQLPDAIKKVKYLGERIWVTPHAKTCQRGAQAASGIYINWPGIPAQRARVSRRECERMLLVSNIGYRIGRTRTWNPLR